MSLLGNVFLFANLFQSMDKTVCHHVLHFTDQFSQSTVVTIKQNYLENSGKQADGLFGIVQRRWCIM